MALAASTVWEVRKTGNALNGGGFNTDKLCQGPIVTLSLYGAGTGYTAEDILTLQDGNTDATVIVDTVDGSGAILTYHLGDAGTGYFVNPWEIEVLGGTGNDDATFIIESVDSPSVDYSQQDVAQLSLTDGATSGIGVAILTSATGGFTEAMVGNLIFVASGTNAVSRFYEIIAYTDTNTVELDQTPDDGVGGLTGDTVFKVGGAVDHPQRILVNNEEAGTMWIKKGVYQRISGSFVLMLGDGYLNQIYGYKTVRGDNPTVEADMPQFDGEGTYYGIYSSNDTQAWGLIRNCTVYNYSSTGIFFGQGTVINCIAHNDGSGTGISASIICGCKAYSNELGFTGKKASECIAYSNTDGFVVNYCLNCIAYANVQAGFYDAYASSRNCIAYNNIRWGFYSDEIPVVVGLFDYNCYYGNGINLAGITAGAHDIEADPLFVDATHGDFTLQNASPCMDVGFQLKFPLKTLMCRVTVTS